MERKLDEGKNFEKRVEKQGGSGNKKQSSKKDDVTKKTREQLRKNMK